MWMSVTTTSKSSSHASANPSLPEVRHSAENPFFTSAACSVSQTPRSSSTIRIFPFKGRAPPGGRWRTERHVQARSTDIHPPCSRTISRRDRQAQARPLPGRLGREERLEEALHRLGRHAFAGVRHVDSEASASDRWQRVMCGAEGKRQRRALARQADRERPPGRHRLGAVHDQVGQGLLDLRAVEQPLERRASPSFVLRWSVVDHDRDPSFVRDRRQERAGLPHDVAEVGVGDCGAAPRKKSRSCRMSDAMRTTCS